VDDPTTIYPGARPNERETPSAPAGPRVNVRLDWTDAQGAHSMTVVRRFVIGSAPHCDVVVVDAAVSRVHAEAEPKAGGLWIRDLNSRNGTFVEGVSVGAAQVQDGYSIRVGTTELRVAVGDAEPAVVEPWPSDRFGPLLGKSAVMRELFATLARVAPLDTCILIQGETGTGKEVVARAIHEASARSLGPFTVVDCAALSETLIEAELFGHVKGAFTGAHQSRAGAIETAHGGTVFLDEIGELPLAMQPRLLRVLESSTIRRIGESQHRKVNVRFLSATHRDLLSMVNRGEFREDLYFRLAIVPVRVPPLRERPEDIGHLLEHFSSSSTGWITPGLVRSLEARPWRGNVRELRNFAARAGALGATEALTLCDDGFDSREPVTAILTKPSSLDPMRFRQGVPNGGVSIASMPPVPVSGVPAAPSLPSIAPVPAPDSPASMGDDAPSLTQPFHAFREQWIGYGERAFIRALLERHHRNVAEAAKEAGLDRTYMYRLIRKHGL
jgi:transcriptional regulator with GAF, ATPase, and Fis domain